MDRKELIGRLNEDLAGEFGAIIQYLTYAAKATGPYRPQIAQFFLAEVADEQLHAQFLANKIVALGGEPVTQARPVPAAKTQLRPEGSVTASVQYLVALAANTVTRWRGGCSSNRRWRSAGCSRSPPTSPIPMPISSAVV